MAVEVADLNECVEANTSHAFTLDEIVKGVAERLESDVRDTLNDLARKERICRLLAGTPWRYQAFQSWSSVE